MGKGKFISYLKSPAGKIWDCTNCYYPNQEKIVRKFLFRHRAKRIGQIIQSMPEFKAQRKRNEVWRELLSTEQAYVNYLQALDKVIFLKTIFFSFILISL